MPRQKDPATLGFERILNDPRTNPFKQGTKPFKEMLNASGMGALDALKYIGKIQKKTPIETDKQKSERRVEKSESDTME